MNNRDYQELVPAVLDVARRAAVEILKVYDTEFEVQEKSDSSPVTRADMAAHRCIVEGLKQVTPDIPILSEEAQRRPFEERRQWNPYWLVDPLDGTREFIKRNGEFTVNIALIHDHEPVLGVVQVPVTGVAYYASRGNGAFVETTPGNPQQIFVRSLQEGPVVVAGSRSHSSERMQEYLERLGEHRLMPMGSSLKGCLVAQGVADVYVRLGKTSEWDTGAMQCVVEEAGGQVTDTEMNPLRYNTRETLINPEFIIFADGSRDWTAPLRGA